MVGVQAKASLKKSMAVLKSIDLFENITKEAKSSG